MKLKHQSLREEVYSPSLPVWLDYGLDDRVLVHLDSFKINPTYNSVGLINWLRQPGLFLNRPPKSIRVNTNPLIKSRGTRTDPAAETKSIGLPADALVPCFLLTILTISSWHETARPLIGTWYFLTVSSWHLASRPFTGTGKKRGTATQTPTQLNRRAVICKVSS